MRNQVILLICYYFAVTTVREALKTHFTLDSMPSDEEAKSEETSDDTESDSEPVPEPIADLGKMTVADLKELCKERKLAVSGTKGQLIARLKGE